MGVGASGLALLSSLSEEECSAVLLANHGVLVFHRTPELAVLVGGVVEEAAMTAINAGAVGGPAAIPEDLRAAALQRTMTFEAEGVRRA